MNTRILIIEDDAYLQESLSELLTRAGYQVELAGLAMQAERLVAEQVYDLIILDIGLPDGDGHALCVRWRQQGLTTPILFLTAQDDEPTLVRALDEGGDDYLTKPFRSQELLSRLRALLRRSRGTILESGDLRLDLTRQRVSRGAEELIMTPTEFQLLATLIQEAGTTLTRRQLLQAVWDHGGDYIDDNNLSVHISRIREKIACDAIVTVRGVGYRWEVHDS